MSSVSTESTSGAISESLATPMTFATAGIGTYFQNMSPLYRFDGTNYSQWSQVVCTFLKGHRRISHLTGNSPKEEDPRFRSWDEKDSMIMSWLWNSIKLEISKNLMFLTTAKAIWENLQQTYSKKKDAELIYELKNQVSSTKQGGMFVTEYYNWMIGLWLQIDHNCDLQLECSHDIQVVQELIENDPVFEFLARLNSEYD